VRVVDSGYTVFPGPAEPGAAFTPEAVAAGETFDVVSWGVVVENTSEWIAIHTDVRVRLVDPAGTVVPTTGAEEWPGQETIVVLRPGERYGMGHTGGLERVVDRPPGNVPADLQVELGSSQWLPPDTDRIEPGDLRASDLRVGQGSEADPLAFRVDFTADSTYEARQPIWATAVFRDAAGRIIGGTSRQNDTLGIDPDRVVYPGGRLPSSITIRYTVPNVDVSQSEVHLDLVGIGDRQPGT
jgi:hypothetical protein